MPDRRGRFLFLLFLLALSLCVIGLGRRAWAETGTVYDLDALIKLAEANNPLLSAAQEQVNQARAAELQSASKLAPRIGSDLTYNHYGANNPMISTPYRDTYKAAISLSQVLHSGGSLESSLRASTLQRQAAEANALRTRQTVRNDVRKAYYDLQRARARLAVAEVTLDLAREHLKQVNSLYTHGVVARNEVLRTQVDVSSAELELIQAQNGTRVALSALEKAVGIALSPERVPEVAPGEEPEIPEPKEDPYEVALQNRPELVSLEDSRKAATEMAKAAAGEARPNISLRGEASYYEDDFFPNEDDWSVSIVATWTLYDRGEVKNKVEEARALSRELLARIDDLRNQIRLEVSTAWQNVESALQRVRVAEDQVQMAEEDYRMALRRYAAQVGTNIDVLDARTALTEARTGYVNAVYDAYSAYSDLIYATGTMEEDFQESR
jgi:outer membrane protein TolC